MLTNDFEVLDPRFRALIYGSIYAERLYDGGLFCEGPVYFPAQRQLIFSDIPRDRLMRWNEDDNTVRVFRQGCGYPNGNTMDREGRLLTCEHQGRRVSRTDHDGHIRTLVDRSHGARLNSPNDVIVSRDGTVWFTDPSYGIESHFEGDLAPQELDGCYVYRLAPGQSEPVAVIRDMVQPNGLAFSPDESLLYVVDSGVSHVENGPRHIRRFHHGADGTLTGGEVLMTCPIGIFDGIDVDRYGNIWASAADGVYCYAPDGDLIGRIRIPEVVSNLCFGGLKRHRLFITTASGLWSVYLKTLGVPFNGI